MAEILLLADLHLSANTPTFNHLIMKQLPLWQEQYTALYLLGDIFDAWIGDDAITDFAQQLIQALYQFSQKKALYFMHGNRDFLIGNDFLKASGAQLLEDPSLITFFGKKYILSHGDLLCSDDIAYQKFRHKTRHLQWQKRFLASPVIWRRFIASLARTCSYCKGKTAKQFAISDATISGIEEMKKRFSHQPQADLIHGHTHRPQVHDEYFYYQNHSCHFKRFVLPDWRPNKQGGLVINVQGEVFFRYFD